VAWSGGSEPGNEVNPAAVQAMAEVGIDITREFPKPWTDETVRAADVVVTMGCGDACPLFSGKRYENWDLTDPAGRGVEPSDRFVTPSRHVSAGSWTNSVWPRTNDGWRAAHTVVADSRYLPFT
jgi:Low molecular weight phosphotyrosine protein phosphatase